ncbi:MFS transporter [Allostella sp. ATCC 35155]|nr:MFS transporter [Stella sp. ATCC 35155]
MAPHAVAIRIAVFYAAMFTVIGLRMPFWPVWLSGRGLDPGEIGVVLAVSSWMQVAAAPWVASRVDRRGERRKVLVILAVAAALGYALFDLAGGFVAILLLAGLVAAVFTPILPLGDNIAVLAVQRHGIDYGRARLWGSISFTLAATGGGIAIAGQPDRVLWLIVAAVAATAVAAAFLPDIRTPRQRDRAGALRILIADRRFVAFLLAAGCLQCSHAMLYGFGTLHWQAAGLSAGFIGLLWAESVVAEIVFFIWGRKALARIGPLGLLAAGGIAGIVRWPLMALGSDPVLLLILQPLHAATFGAAHLGAMIYISGTVAPERSATAQSLHSAIAGGIAFGIAMPLAGLIYGWFGGAGFAAMTVFSAAGLAGTAWLWRLADAR